MNDNFKRKIIDRKFITEEFVRSRTTYKFSIKETIDRITYQANILECGHMQKVSNKADKKREITKCYMCLVNEQFPEEG